MLRRLSLAAAFAVLLRTPGTGVFIGTPAAAALKPGAAAPAFDAAASLGGKVFDFNLRRALRKGPVVLYFYPAAFTPGCTLEAHEFASHSGDFAKLGASVIGVSGDGIEKLRAFSVSACRSRFAVAADGDHEISRAYDATVGFGAFTYSDRTSYVISPAGRIVYAYRSPDARRHVALTLAALARLRAK